VTHRAQAKKIHHCNTLKEFLQVFPLLVGTTFTSHFLNETVADFLITSGSDRERIGFYRAFIAPLPMVKKTFFILKNFTVNNSTTVHKVALGNSNGLSWDNGQAQSAKNLRFSPFNDGSPNNATFSRIHLAKILYCQAPKRGGGVDTGIIRTFIKSPM
jgi:hypothetical protein